MIAIEQIRPETTLALYVDEKVNFTSLPENVHEPRWISLRITNTPYKRILLTLLQVQVMQQQAW